MRPEIRRFSVAAVLVSFMFVSACSGAPDKPTSDEATKLLIATGDKLLASQDIDALGSAAAIERADRDSESGCLKGQVQRLFRAQGDFDGPPYVRSPGSAVGLLTSWLRLEGYDVIVDNLDLRDENLSTAVLRHPTNDITFLINARTERKPNIMIVGKTGCYPRS
ncbi:hypothetical protein [Nonomuraea typhae]|uniref:Uncharacterized protein n=1 Tax=Nonomuraea typhae TaxID=2603600 RepID=A0ABW7YPY3_9ACTN